MRLQPSKGSGGALQGNCSSLPPGSPLEPGRTSTFQCRVRVNKNFLKATEQLWLQDLYIEAYQNDTEAASPTTTILEASAADVWVTSSVLVGDPLGSSRAMHVTDGGRLYARGALSATPLCFLFCCHARCCVRRFRDIADCQ